MSIRFKFRSSVNFDTLEIDGDKPYISVGELRSKILCQKKLNNVSHKDFDLVFSDALTGQEYNDDKFEIPSGSSVIVKRVPVEPVPSAMLGHQRLEASELSDDIPKGLDDNKPEKIVLEEMLEPEFDKPIKLEKVASANCIDLQNAGLPTELRCPLCNTYFKEAVMIPCCQRSFCEKCICEVLVATRRCPRCSSTKFRVEHLLPNLCLRQAIEHLLESQILATPPENDLQKYVPDGESGIQGKGISSAVPVTKRNLDLFNSPSAMEKGNQDVAESAYESLNRKNSFLEVSEYRNLNAIGLPKSISLPKVKHSDGRPEDLAPVADSQGINQPLNMPQAHMPCQADSTSRKRGLWVDPGGGDQRFAVDNRNKKVDRTCYMCGSSDHLIRDCPIASTRHLMSHTGDPIFQGGMPCYPTPYWNGAAFPPVNPYMNMYGSPGMVPFNGNMVPVTPYGVPHYLPSMYSNLPVPSGTMMGGLAAPVGTRSEQPLTQSENLEPQHGDKRRNLSAEKREHSFDYEDDVCYKRHHCDELQRSVEYKSHRERGKTPSNSEESHERKLRREHHRDKHLNEKIQSVNERHGKHSHSTNTGRDGKSCHTDRSISGVDNVHKSNHRYDEARHKKHYRSFTRHHERREQSGSDSTWSRHQIQKERSVKSKAESDVDFQHKHNSYLCGLEPSSYGDQKKRCKDINPGPVFRESRERTKPLADKFYRDRRQMVKVSDEDWIEGHHHKRKKRAL